MDNPEFRGPDKVPHEIDGDNIGMTEMERHRKSEKTPIVEPKANREKYPLAVIFIFISEFCDRFSIYGLHTVLIIYLRNFIQLSENNSTAIFHLMATISYTMPLLGAFLADEYLGQYKTILYFSFIYFLGDLVMFLASMRPFGAPNPIGSICGLLVIAFGSGCMNSSVSAFGAQQINPNETKHLNTYFSIYVLVSNLAGILSVCVIPVLRSDIKCFNTDCFPLAFAVTTAFMFLSFVVFACGTPLYKRDESKTDNLFKNVISCISHGLRMKMRAMSSTMSIHATWLDHSNGKYGVKFVDDVKSMLKIIGLFMPLSMFWALFSQLGSRWTLQAQKLNAHVTMANYSYRLKPEQITILNPLLMTLLIPAFNWLVYPLLDKLNLFRKLLNRIKVGMVFASLAFACSAMIEMTIDRSFVTTNLSNKIEFLNLAAFDIRITTNESTVLMDPYGRVQIHSWTNVKLEMSTEFGLAAESLTIKQNTIGIRNYYVVHENDEHMSGSSISIVHIKSSLLRQPVGKSQIRFYTLNNGNYSAILKSNGIDLDVPITNNRQADNENAYIDIDSGTYELKVTDFEAKVCLTDSLVLLNGARITLLLYRNSITRTYNAMHLVDLHEYKVSIFYQLIQYLLITIAQIMVSISGLAFAYAQAPDTMKSVFQATWLLTKAFGNIIVIFVAQMNLVANQFEYILFACLILITMFIFHYLSGLYQADEMRITIEGTSSRIDRTDEVQSSTSS